MIIIVTKAANLSWATTKVLLVACRGNRISADEMERASKNFSTISASTARQVLEFYQRRSSSTEAVGG
jgi:citrate lyase synthetase